MSGRGRGGFRGGRGGGFGGRGGYSRGGPRSGGEITTKLFVGNIPATAEREDLVQHFEKFGRVVEADIVANYAFVHYANEDEAVAAKNGMHGFLFQGNEIRVELSRSKVRQKPGMGSGEKCFRCGKEGHWSTECTSGGGGGGGGGGRRGPPTTKLFVGNLPESATNSELEELFSKHGKVVEADVLKNFGFVHFSSPDEAEAAVAALHHSMFKGEVIKVEMSRSRLHQKPGDAGRSSGYMSKDCPRYPSGGPRGGRGGRRPPFGRDYSPEPYYRDRYRDRYNPYERPDPYERRGRAPPPPPPTPRDPYSRDPYERPPPDYYRRSPERDSVDEYAKRRADEAYFEFYNYYSGRRREAPPLPPQLPPSGYDEPRLPQRERPLTPPEMSRGMGLPGPREMGPPRDMGPLRDMIPPRDMGNDLGPRPIPQQPNNNYTDFSGILNNLLHQSL